MATSSSAMLNSFARSIRLSRTCTDHWHCKSMLCSKRRVIPCLDLLASVCYYSFNTTSVMLFCR